MFQAIIWNILPNVRRDALLMKQARMINLFKAVEIWRNVLIIVKQSRNPQDDGQGALAAAKTFNPRAKVPVLGFSYADDPSLTPLQRKKIEGLCSLFMCGARVLMFQKHFTKAFLPCKDFSLL